MGGLVRSATCGVRWLVRLGTGRMDLSTTCNLTMLVRSCRSRLGLSTARRLYSVAASPVLRIQSHPAPHSGTIKVLLLDRPEARNALSRQLVSELGKQIDIIDAEGGQGSTRALIIASNVDTAFCAGADLKERRGWTQEEYQTIHAPVKHVLTLLNSTKAFLTNLRRIFTSISNLRIPTITAISSMALGGGLELALCSQLRVFGSTAIVGQPETRLGIIPGAGGTYRLPGLIGLNRARDMILTGRRVSAAEAYFLGLCDRLIEVTPEEQQEPGQAKEIVLRESLDLARSICEGGPIALTQALQAVNNWQKGEKAENEAYDVVLASEDRIEALKAFAEKRPPVFKGK